MICQVDYIRCETTVRWKTYLNIDIMRTILPDITNQIPPDIILNIPSFVFYRKIALSNLDFSEKIYIYTLILWKWFRLLSRIESRPISSYTCHLLFSFKKLHFWVNSLLKNKKITHWLYNISLLPRFKSRLMLFLIIST